MSSEKLKFDKELTESENQAGNQILENSEGEPSPEDILEYQKMDELIEQQLGQLAEEERAADSSEFKLEFTENEIERVPISDLFKKINYKIMKFVVPLVLSEDRIIASYARLMERSTELGKDSGRLFNFLAKHGIRKPRIDHEYVETKARLPERVRRAIEDAKVIKRLPFKKIEKLEMIKSALFDERFKETQAYREEMQEADHKIEYFTQITIQDEGINFIDESILNSLYDDFNICTSSIYVYNKATGLTLELNEMLPKDYYLMPSEMREFRDVTPEESGEIKNLQKIVPRSLKDFKGSQETNGSFYVSPKFKAVAYGNLNEKGGMLSLLHEIAHAWQTKYQGKNAKLEWLDFYDNVTSILNSLQCKDELARVTNCPNLYDTSEFYEKLNNHGVEIDDEYLYSGQELGGGKHVLKMDDMKIEGNELVRFKSNFYIKSERIKPLVEDFVKDERDAWAHAIRILRFLRKKGFDLEPELKTTNDFDEIVHNKLGTYSHSMDERMLPTKDIKEFTKRSRFSSRWPKADVQ